MKQKLKSALLRVLCKLGLHRWTYKPILATLDTYGLQGGEECYRCGSKRIKFSEAAILTEAAYNRGRDRATIVFTAYGRGVTEVARIYGKAYVQDILDKIEG